MEPDFQLRIRSGPGAGIQRIQAAGNDEPGLSRGRPDNFNAQGGGPSHYSYDEAGRLLKKVFERADGLRTETSFVFDDIGNLVSSHRVYHEAERQISCTSTTSRRLLGKTFKQSTGEEGFEKYRHDRLGRLVGATYRNMDFWLNGELTFS